MPTKTIILLTAMAAIILVIVIAIIVMVIVTGNFLAKKSEEERPNSHFLLYVQNVDKFKCPKCGGELKLYLGRDQKTYYRCKDMDNCDFMAVPEDLIYKVKK